MKGVGGGFGITNRNTNPTQPSPFAKGRAFYSLPFCKGKGEGWVRNN